MNFPTFPRRIFPKFRKEFWLEDSQGACYGFNGHPLYRPDKKLPVQIPVDFKQADPRIIRFRSKPKALQWLQKMNKRGLIQSDFFMIHRHAKN